MKKVIPIAALFVLLAGAFFFLQQRQAASRVRAVKLAPGNTLFFAHFPDLQRTSERWPRTELNQLLREPEVQAFLEKPKSKLPWMAENQARLEQLAQALPREAFLAVTSYDAPNPTFVAGVCFEGNRSALEELIADGRQNLRQARPAGKADLVNYAGTEIETYTDKDLVIAEVFRDNWYFISNQLELLQATIDRYDGKPGSGEEFAASAPYLKSMAALPSDADLVLYAQVRVLADRLTTLVAAAGQKPDAPQLAALQQVEALSASVKMDGALLRDTVFVLMPQTGQPTTMPRRSLALTTSDTLLYYVGALARGTDLAASAAPLALLSPNVPDLTDFTEMFGPELSVLVDWPLVAAQPGFVLALDVRNSSRAQEFLVAATAGRNGEPGWIRSEAEGAIMFQTKSEGLLNLSPVIALSPDFLLFGISQEAVTATLSRQKAGVPPLDKKEDYTRATKLVGEPTSAFAYLDTKTLFERAYGIFRPFLAMSMAFNPEAGQYFDAGKLPTTDAIVRHLGPSTYSQRQVENGMIVESAGTLTLNQAMFGTAVGVGAAAFPAIQQLMAGGGLMPPGFGPPVAAPPAPAVPVPAPAPDPAPTPAPPPSTEPAEA